MGHRAKLDQAFKQRAPQWHTLAALLQHQAQLEEVSDQSDQMFQAYRAQEQVLQAYELQA